MENAAQTPMIVQRRIPHNENAMFQVASARPQTRDRDLDLNLNLDQSRAKQGSCY
jgi:hypothetical protein